MHKAIFFQTNFARCLATPEPQPSEQKQQQFCESHKCREANHQSSLNEESTASVIVRRNPESRPATGSAAYISNRDSSSLDAADNADPSPHNSCDRNRDSLNLIVPNEAVSLEANSYVVPQPQVGSVHQQQDVQGFVQGHNQAGINVGQPPQIKPVVVGPQAEAPLQQQDVVQQEGPQQLAVTERTTMQTADAQPGQTVAAQPQPANAQPGQTVAAQPQTANAQPEQTVAAQPQTANAQPGQTVAEQVQQANPQQPRGDNP